MSQADMKIKAIAPWYGSNRGGAKSVGKQLGKLEWVGVAFAGGMCELPQISARSIVANDIHRHLINMVRVIGDPVIGPKFYRRARRNVLHPDALEAAQKRCVARETENVHESRLFVDREYVSHACDAAPDIQWAEDYFTCCWCARSHVAGTENEFDAGMSLRWNAGGGDSAVRYYNAVRSLPSWRRALKNVSFSTLDALAFLDNCKDQKGHGIYCDPPFPGPGDRYKHKIDAGYQSQLAERVATFQNARVVMRFYDHPLIRRLYPIDKWTWQFSTGKNQSNNDTPEVLILNGPGYGESA